MWSKARPRAFVPLARLERDLQPAVALTAPTGMLTASHTSLPARVRDLAARVHTACHVSCLRLLCSCLYWSVARLRARPTARVYRAGPPAPAPFSPATDSGRLEKSPTNSPTTDELGSSGPALLCRARALVASHVLATCATVHITPLILSLRAWGGRVGDSQSDGGDFSFRTKVFARFPHTTAHARAPRLVPHCWHRVAVELRLSAAGALHACYAWL